MAISNGYVTLAELKAHLMSSATVTFTANSDTIMEQAIEAASRSIDQFCETTFYARTETRYFAPKFYDLIQVDDLLAVTTLKTDDNGDGVYETTWATTDYILEPINAPSWSSPMPYRQIRQDHNGDYSFPIGIFSYRDGRMGVRYTVEVAGTWGYCTLANIPASIKQACLLLSHRLFRRKDAIFGIAGAPALGVQVVQSRVEKDSDIAQLLEGFSRNLVFTP